MANPDLTADLPEEGYEDDSVDVEERIAEIEGECEQVFANPENGNLLNRILDMARVSYDKDPKGWDAFFVELKSELVSTDDEDNIKDILENYLRKAKLELS
jgi:hypothetical protein